MEEKIFLVNFEHWVKKSTNEEFFIIHYLDETDKLKKVYLTKDKWNEIKNRTASRKEVKGIFGFNAFDKRELKDIKN